MNLNLSEAKIVELCREYGLAIVWAEAALQITETREDQEDIELFLNKARMEHNNNWISPKGYSWF